MKISNFTYLTSFFKGVVGLAGSTDLDVAGAFSVVNGGLVVVLSSFFDEGLSI